MGTEGFKRKITAIVSADVYGYSKPMGEASELLEKAIALDDRLLYPDRKFHFNLDNQMAI